MLAKPNAVSSTRSGSGFVSASELQIGFLKHVEPPYKINNKDSAEHIKMADWDGCAQLLPPSPFEFTSEPTHLPMIDPRILPQHRTTGRDGKLGLDDWMKTCIKRNDDKTGVWWQGWLFRRRGAISDFDQSIGKALGATPDPALTDLTKAQLTEYKSMFDKLDSDGSGMLDRFEVCERVGSASERVREEGGVPWGACNVVGASERDEGGAPWV